MNHGIELHGDNVDYAIHKVKDLRLTCRRFDELEFCEPTFVAGNIFEVPEVKYPDR